MTTQETKTFGTLNQGTVVNFYRSTTADDINFVVLAQYSDDFGKWTEVLRLDTYEKESFSQQTKIENFWSIVKEN